ncbi:DUF7344 domain-containing protein [Haladaptatus sp. NG-SE-30]
MTEDSWGDLYDILLDPSLDNLTYRALAQTPRRYTMYLLLEWDRVSVDELADILTGWLYATEYRMTTPVDRDQLVTDLHRTHIPLLETAGLVVYDERQGELRLGDLSLSVVQLLEWAQSNEYEDQTRTNSDQ